jgi:hypothetical protein
MKDAPLHFITGAPLDWIIASLRYFSMIFTRKELGRGGFFKLCSSLGGQSDWISLDSTIEASLEQQRDTNVTFLVPFITLLASSAAKASAVPL